MYGCVCVCVRVWQVKRAKEFRSEMKILSIKWILVAADNMSAVNHTIQFDVKAVDEWYGYGRCAELQRALYTFTVCVRFPYFSCRTICHATIVRWQEQGRGWGCSGRDSVGGKKCVHHRRSVRRSLGETWDTKQLRLHKCTVCNHPLALLAHASQCLELHVTHFCLLFTLFIVQNNFRFSILYTITYTHRDANTRTHSRTATAFGKRIQTLAHAHK